MLCLRPTRGGPSSWAGLGETLVMGLLRISQLTPAQVDAVFRSDRFCELSDAQLAALHHRFEQLKALRHQARIKRRRRRRLMVLLAVAVVTICTISVFAWQEVSTFFVAMVALGFLAFIWLGVIGAVWEVGQKLITCVAKSRNKPRPGTPAPEQDLR